MYTAHPQLKDDTPGTVVGLEEPYKDGQNCMDPGLSSPVRDSHASV